MSVRPLRPWLYRTIFFTLAYPAFVLAQGTPLTLGPLAVNVPPGWNAQTSAVPVRIFSPESTPQQFFAVEFFPPEQTTQELREHHSLIWARVAAAVGPASPPQSGVLGRFVWTRAEVARPFGRKETLVLYSTKAGQLYIAVAVDGTHASLVARNLPVVEAMLSNAILSDAASVPAPASSGPSDSVGNQAYAANPSSLGEYVYATPPEWTANQYPDGIVLTSPASATGERCLISLWPMRPAGASLQNDANNIFAEVFRTYEPRNQTSRGTPMPQSITRGTSGDGWDYLIVRRGIGKPSNPPGQYASLLGFVFVARLNDRLAVISGLSKDPLVSTCMGELVSNAWPKFFYSLKFRNWSAPDQGPAMRKKIAGVWTAVTATAGDRFTFAANGRYAGAAAAQQYYQTPSGTGLTTTQAYFGDGAYTLRGNTITLTHDDRKNQPETGFVRVEEESKDGGRTWVESLYLLRTSTVDGKEYELRYYKK